MFKALKNTLCSGGDIYLVQSLATRLRKRNPQYLLHLPNFVYLIEEITYLQSSIGTNIR